ncbi:hypothetical protein NOX81_04825 [Enterobacter kobei]|nr:hypothetical protein [Enterobacter kobei]MCQ4372593.1 hypothetical protein [Enterobacter kobei]HDC4673058.1 hypothetical protein [Enterobacter kobei]
MSELVKRGHDQEAELKSSCGAVDVRDVAQLISDLATHLDVQLARSNALAAELNEIKVAVMARMKLHEEIRNAGRPPHTDFWHQSIYMADKRVNDSLSSTPNHDAFLAEVRAQGVEMAVDVVKQCYDNICAGGLQENREYEESIVQPHLDGIDDELNEIIAQLRKGVQS